MSERLPFHNPSHALVLIFERTKARKVTSWTEVLDLKSIGAILRAKRKYMKITQKDAAGLCNVGVRFISDLENGKPSMHFDKTLKVLRYVGYVTGMRER
jgi:y4mF family transcriptional regulator